MRLFSRCSLALLLATLISGCSVVGLDEPRAGLFNECTWNRSNCMYEGKYEPGEREYAEEEARRLNQAALERLRRSGSR